MSYRKMMIAAVCVGAMAFVASIGATFLKAADLADCVLLEKTAGHPGFSGSLTPLVLGDTFEMGKWQSGC